MTKNVSIVATGAADIIVSRTIAESPSFPPGIDVTPFSESLCDTIALAQRAGACLSPATRRLAEHLSAMTVASCEDLAAAIASMVSARAGFSRLQPGS